MPSKDSFTAEIKGSRVVNALCLCAAVGFTGLGVTVSLMPDFDWLPDFRWAIYLSTAFFACLIPQLAWALFDSRPRLIIDREGILVRSLGVGKIPWREIEDVHLVKISRCDFACLSVSNPQKYLKKMRPSKRVFHKIDQALGFSPILVNLSGASSDAGEIFDLIVKMCELGKRESSASKQECQRES